MAAMFPPSPGLFSTMTRWLTRADSPSASARFRKSALDPAASELTIRITREG
jgi:hypothetical protein